MSTVKMMAEQVAKKLGRGIEIDARHEKYSPNRIWILVRRPDKELGEIGMRFGPFRRNEVGKALAMFADMLDMAS